MQQHTKINLIPAKALGGHTTLILEQQQQQQETQSMLLLQGPLPKRMSTARNSSGLQGQKFSLTDYLTAAISIASNSNMESTTSSMETRHIPIGCEVNKDAQSQQKTKDV